jgi:hypothetical protein
MFKDGSSDGFAPTMEQKASSGIRSSLRRAWMMHFAPTNARIVLTLSGAPSKLHIPLPI